MVQALMIELLSGSEYLWAVPLPTVFLSPLLCLESSRGGVYTHIMLRSTPVLCQAACLYSLICDQSCLLATGLKNREL